MTICNRAACTEEVLPPRRKYCSTKCKNVGTTTESKRRTKEKLVQYFGGKCQLCGYDRCVSALQFHHPDKNKEFGLAKKQTYAFESLVAEASKCQLLCANCHAEVHWS